MALYETGFCERPVVDPSQVLQHAIDYLIATRGERAVKASRALQILANARHLCESACIADLLGPKARALGVRCPCVKCQASPENFALIGSGPEPVKGLGAREADRLLAEDPPRRVRDAKMAAAGDNSLTEK